METGTLNRIITISTLTEVVASGDVSTTWGTPETVRASVKQIDGTRYLKENELIDKAVYEIQFWDNAYTNNIQIVYDGMTLYPIRPITKNPDGSNLNIVTAIVSTKK